MALMDGVLAAVVGVVDRICGGDDRRFPWRLVIPGDPDPSSRCGQRRTETSPPVCTSLHKLVAQDRASNPCVRISRKSMLHRSRKRVANAGQKVPRTGNCFNEIRHRLALGIKVNDETLLPFLDVKAVVVYIKPKRVGLSTTSTTRLKFSDHRQAVWASTATSSPGMILAVGFTTCTHPKSNCSHR